MKNLINISGFSLMILGIVGCCNYSITMIHTQGKAYDLVDDADTDTSSAHLNIPMSVIPK